jgi:hypothetical protein
MLRKALICALLAVMAPTTHADWVPLSLSDHFQETFESAMAETDTTVPVFSGGGFFETDTYWRVEENGADVSMSLGLAGTFPSDGGYNMGTVEETLGYRDRALGVFSQNATSRSVRLKLRNDTAADLGELYVEFDLERWIAPDPARAAKGGLVLEHDGGSAVLVETVTIAGISQPFWDEGQYGWVDGNTDENSVHGLGGLFDLTGLGVSIAPGEEFTLRWDLSEAGDPQTKSTGLAVDNILVAVPEPTTAGGLLVGILAMLVRRRLT